MVVADLEAGIGTLTRLDDRQVDAVVVVVESTAKSIEVGTRAAALARQKSAGRVVVVANRLRGDADLVAIRAAFPGEEIVPIPDDPAITAADRAGAAPLDRTPTSPAVLALAEMAGTLADGHR